MKGCESGIECERQQQTGAESRDPVFDPVNKFVTDGRADQGILVADEKRRHRELHQQADGDGIVLLGDSRR
jgi:hypothetical protein